VNKYDRTPNNHYSPVLTSLVERVGSDSSFKQSITCSEISSSTADWMRLHIRLVALITSWSCMILSSLLRFLVKLFTQPRTHACWGPILRPAWTIFPGWFGCQPRSRPYAPYMRHLLHPPRGRSRVGHGNVLSHWWTWQRKWSRSRSRPEPELDVPSGVGLGCRQDKRSGRTETGVATSGRYRFNMAELDHRSV